MSFSSITKSELCTLINNSCCNSAELYGFALFAGTFKYDEIKFVTENVNVASRFVKLIDECMDIKAYIKTNNRGIYICGIDSNDCGLMFEKFSHKKLETSIRANRANIENDCCYSAFLRGAFLACGFINDPGKEYHLELIVNYYKLSYDLELMLSELDLEPKRVPRRGKYVLYFNDSEKIEDLLTFIGASNAALDIMNVKIYKDVKNHAVRAFNCDSANLLKTIVASEQQLKAIKIIMDNHRFNDLPDKLKEIAILRKKNPELSLRQISELASVSKSGVNHRIKKIIELADKINGGNS